MLAGATVRPICACVVLQTENLVAMNSCLPVDDRRARPQPLHRRREAIDARPHQSFNSKASGGNPARARDDSGHRRVRMRRIAPSSASSRSSMAGPRSVRTHASWHDREGLRVAHDSAPPTTPASPIGDSVAERLDGIRRSLDVYGTLAPIAPRPDWPRSHRDAPRPSPRWRPAAGSAWRSFPPAAADASAWCPSRTLGSSQSRYGL